MPRCSVIIPAYNAEQYLAQTVNSALNQSYRDFEVIVVDDGSTDRTPQILADFGNKIRSVSQENSGPSSARNRGLELASGEFIALLDADDLFIPNRLESMIQYLESHSDDGILTADSFLVYEDQVTEETFYQALPFDRRFRLTNQGYWIVQYNFINGQATFRRTVAENNGGFDETLPPGVEDWDLWMRSLNAGVRAAMLPETLGYYRIRTHSLSHQPEKAHSNALTLLRKAQSSSLAVPGLAGRIRFSEGNLALLRGDVENARKSLIRSLVSRNMPVSTRLRALASYLAPKRSREYLASSGVFGRSVHAQK